ncbi:hypothetical protein H5410_026416, partial [Solanum commersonii]
YLDFEGKHGHYIAKTLTEKIKSAVKWSSQCVAEHFCEAVLHHPIIQDAKMMKKIVERESNRVEDTLQIILQKIT